MTIMAKILWSESGIKSISFRILFFFLGTVTIPARWVMFDNVLETFNARSLFDEVSVETVFSIDTYSS